MNQSINRIAAVDLTQLDRIRNAFEAHIDPDLLNAYRLPIKDVNTRVVVGISGGADSACLALFSAVYLAPIYPRLEFLFTDTKAEPESCHETLAKIEKITGIAITRLIPDKGLFELIAHQNGFLPSVRERWCTRELKIKPLMDYIPKTESVISLAGIRADEADRDGLSFSFSMDVESRSAMPFIELGITKEIVFSVLNSTEIGVSESYYFKSRSGCTSCFFLRNAEVIGTLLSSPADFARSEQAEKLSAADSARWNNIPEIMAGASAFYPVPAFVDIRKPEKLPAPHPKKVSKGPKRDSQTTDMFGGGDSGSQEDHLYAAYALYVSPLLGYYGDSLFTPGVYWSELITISTSHAGIKSGLGNYYQFRRSTPMPRYDIADLKIVIVRVSFPSGIIDTAPPARESYTWKSGTAYKQIRHLVGHVNATLKRADLERSYLDAVNALERAEDAGDVDAAMYAAENLQNSLEVLLKAEKTSGKITWEGLYIPTLTAKKQVQLQLAGLTENSKARAVREGLEYDDVHRACTICSI